MPWNTTASALGSRPGSIARGQQGPLSAAAGFPSSIGGFASSVSAIAPGATIPGSHDRRRLTSASPLVGRGRQRFSSIELPIQEAGDDFSLGPLDEGELYGPAAGVSTQQAEESQWMRATLDAESNNFLDFVKAEIAKRPVPEDEDELAAETRGKEMFFEELLPPSRHTKIVAAQALHHVLALASKGLLAVTQAEDYGPIALGVGDGL